MGIVCFWFDRFSLVWGGVFVLVYGFSDLSFGVAYCTSLVWWFVRGSGGWWLVCWFCFLVGWFDCLWFVLLFGVGVVLISGFSLLI